MIAGQRSGNNPISRRGPRAARRGLTASRSCLFKRNRLVQLEREAMSTSGNMGAAGDRLGQATRDVAESVKEVGNTVRDAAQEQYERARDTAAGYYDQGRERFMDAESNLEDYIRERPIKSLLIGLCVGYLIGKFL